MGRRLLAAALVAGAFNLAAATAAGVKPRLHVQVLAINDFHGALEGAPYLATHLRRLRSGRSVTVGAGDMVGGSPLVSGHFGDAPAVEALDAMGLDFTAVGNHEFDAGLPALRALQRRARFAWLGANVSGARFAATRMVGRVGFVGLTLEDTPGVAPPGSVAGLRFADEVETAERHARELRARGADAVFVMLHEGGEQRGPDPNGCDDLSGPIVAIAEGLSGDVDAIASGHTHAAYVCTIGGVVVTSAGAHGRLVTDYDLAFDRRTHRLERVSARNVAVTRDVPPDRAVHAILERYAKRVAPLADRVVATLREPLERRGALGGVVAEALRVAGGADLGLMNPGNVRADLAAGTVTFADLYAVSPFGYRVETRAYTGAELRAILDQQAATGTTLHRSPGFDPASAGDDETVRVALPAFLAGGGDGFTAARAGRRVALGPLDVDALAAYLSATSTSTSSRW